MPQAICGRGGADVSTRVARLLRKWDDGFDGREMSSGVFVNNCESSADRVVCLILGCFFLRKVLMVDAVVAALKRSCIGI